MSSSISTRKQPVAFQGEHGAYSEEAVIRYCGEETETLPCSSFREVFEVVSAGQASRGVVPVENTHAGTIRDTYDLLMEFEPLAVTGDVIVPVHHCLMAMPGESLSTLTTVLSHPQALAQCDDFIREHGLDRQAHYDTAGSARTIKQQAMKATAAIAARRAAEYYGLDLLAESIQTDDQNATRFYVIEPRRQWAPPGTDNRTVLVLATKHEPGALYRSLGIFARRNINLTKLESRPRRGQPWHYLFYLELAAHPEQPECAEALSELKSHCELLRLLGAFPQNS